MSIKRDLNYRKNNLEESIARKQAIVDSLPKGKLRISKHGNYYNWYHVSNDESKYLPKEDKEFASQLAYKGYLEASLRDEVADLKAIRFFLKHASNSDSAENYLSRNDEYKRLATCHINDFDDEIASWLEDKYVGKIPEPGNLKFMSQAGIKVRSKSEQIIVAHLVANKIAFKYEEHMYFNSQNLYPDFTIMHPKTHRIYIWEHLGMMDKPSYRMHNLQKINLYGNIGFIPGDNLILTFETEKSGIDEVQIEQIIEHYFL